MTKATPTITWPAPSSIVVGTALSATQLNATSGGVPGTFVYTPPAGTLLPLGVGQALSVTFTPTDTTNYNSATANVAITVTATQTGGSYATNFALTENPVSEVGNWITGKATGLKWSNIRTTPGLAFGTETGSGGFDDSIAILNGTWGPTQTATATVRSVNQQSGNTFEEVELLLRFSITANSATGYEVLFSVRHDGTQYVQIVRWNGPLGNFTQVDGRTGPGLNNGDQIKATIVGNIITAYINNVAIFSVTDSTYANGAPGMGFYLQGGTSALNSDFGLSSYSATDGGFGAGVPSAPAPADAATGVNRLPTLTWTSTGATAYDVSFGTTASPPVVSTGQSSASYSPSALAAATTYFWQAVGHSNGGTNNGPVWSFTTTPKITPTITWATPAAITYGTALSATQLNAIGRRGGDASCTRRRRHGAERGRGSDAVGDVHADRRGELLDGDRRRC